MRQLSIVRHAHAEHFSSAGSDFDRVLTESGRAEARVAAEKARETIFRPDLILTSPAARALETARIFADAFGIKPESFLFDRAVYTGDGRELADILESLDASFRNVILVGHNPALTELAMRLALPPVPILRPASVLTLNPEIDDWFRLSEKRSEIYFSWVP